MRAAVDAAFAGLRWRRAACPSLGAWPHRGVRKAHRLRRRSQPDVRHRARHSPSPLPPGRTASSRSSTRLTAGGRVFSSTPDLAPTVGHWSNYPMTVARRLARNFPGLAVGADVAFKSTIPRAAGLSTSSALVTAMYLVLASVNRLSERAEFQQAIPTREALAGYLGSIENGQAFGGLRGDHGVGTFGGSEDHTAILLSEHDRLAWYHYGPVTRLGTVALAGRPDLRRRLQRSDGGQDWRRARALQPRGHARDGAGRGVAQEDGARGSSRWRTRSPAGRTRSTALQGHRRDRPADVRRRAAAAAAGALPRRGRRPGPCGDRGAAVRRASTISDASRTSRNAPRNSCSGTRCQRRVPWRDSHGGTARLPPRPSARDSAAASGRSCRSSMRLDSRRRGEQPMPPSTRARRRPRRSSRRVRVRAPWRLEPFGSGRVGKTRVAC